MFSNDSKYQSSYGQIKHSKAYEKFHFKGKTEGIALKYVLKGYEKYRINDHVMDVKQGQFILVQEQQPFEAQATLKTQNICGLCVDLNPTALDIDLADIYTNPLLFNLPFASVYFSSLQDQLTMLNTTTFSKCNDEHDMLKSLSKEIEIFATDLYKLHLRLATHASKISTQRVLLCQLLAAKHFIHQHYRQKITLAYLAKYVGISKFHFVRLFKLCFQQSPLELQEELKMQTAIELIDKKATNLSTIAYDLGFGDLASFSKKFTKYFAMSPSQYQKNGI